MAFLPPSLVPTPIYVSDISLARTQITYVASYLCQFVKSLSANCNPLVLITKHKPVDIHV